MYTTYMKIHYLEAKQNKEKKITFRKGKTCEFSQCIITDMKIHYLEAKQNKEKKIHFAKGKTCEF